MPSLCADPESFVRGVQLNFDNIFFYEGRDDTNTTKSGPSLARQWNAI